MKHVVRCKDCKRCAVCTPVGFLEDPTYICTWLENDDGPLEVEPDDGCTFGKRGERKLTIGSQF